MRTRFCKTPELIENFELAKADNFKGWNKGVPATEESKRKNSEAHKGKHWKLVDGKRVWY